MPQSSLPRALHRSYNLPLQARFHGEHRFSLDQGNHSETLKKSSPEYNFTTPLPCITFQGDLRGRSHIEIFHPVSIRSQRSSYDEATNQAVQLWLNEEVSPSTHVITFFAGNIEVKELEFPVLGFDHPGTRWREKHVQLNFTCFVEPTIKSFRLVRSKGTVCLHFMFSLNTLRRVTNLSRSTVSRIYKLEK